MAQIVADIPLDTALARLALVAVRTRFVIDRYVVCSCGWVSLPYSDCMPTELACEACEARADGDRQRLAFQRATENASISVEVIR